MPSTHTQYLFSENEKLKVDFHLTHKGDKKDVLIYAERGSIPAYLTEQEVNNLSTPQKQFFMTHYRNATESEFRRRKTDKFKGSATGVILENDYSETELRCFPFIAIGLYMAAATMAMETGVKHVYVMMEPRLARSMKFVGIHFIQLGKPIEYHGLRAPYYINADMFMSNLSSGFKSLYETIKADLNTEISSLNSQRQS